MRLEKGWRYFFPYKNEKISKIIYAEKNQLFHAEANALIHARQDCHNFTLYSTLFPCDECAKLIIQAGIKQIFYSHDKHQRKKEVIAAKRMLTDAAVEFTLISAPKINIER